MTSGRNLVTTIFLAIGLFFMSSGASEAQDNTPSPRMLLNLDLFTAPPPAANPAVSAAGDDASTIEQLRALSAMGYLGADSPPPDPADANAPPIHFNPGPQGESSGPQGDLQ